MKDAKYRRLGGACVCGRKVLLSHGGAGGMAKWDCCSPWLDRATNEIVGYGWDMRSDGESPPGAPRKPAKVAPAVEHQHPLLSQIGSAPSGMATCVYERFDADGVHLYAGISDAPAKRAKIHLKRSTWFLFAISGTEQWFPSRAAAENAERSIIATRRPIFNRQHAHPEAREALIRYLVERSRFDLLEVNVTWG